MQLYLVIAKFSFQRYLVYPLEFISDLVKRVLQIVFIVWFWNLVIAENPNVTNLENIIVYFIVVSAISDYIMVERLELARYISKQIKTGQINNFLIKPLNTVFYSYAYSLGERLTNIGFAIAAVIIALSIRPTTLSGFCLFIIFLFIGIIIGFSINMLIGTASFVLTDTVHLQYLSQLTIRSISGAFIPLVFFPEHIKNFLDLTPFPYLTFKPINYLTDQSGDILRDLAVGIIWIVILNLIAYIFWKISIKNYEAVGI